MFYVTRKLSGEILRKWGVVWRVALLGFFSCVTMIRQET